MSFNTPKQVSTSIIDSGPVINSTSRKVYPTKLLKLNNKNEVVFNEKIEKME